jgi:phenylalanyl-tRNA synthetase beta chain
MPAENEFGFKRGGISWDRERIVVGEIQEVKPHQDADRLVLCDLFDGQRDHVVLTGAPNLFPFKGQGRLAKPIKVAYAKEGSSLYDGHADAPRLITLKRTKIRGVDSYSMVCSEKELGISEEHEGVIFLDDDAPVGTPLADYMGDVVFEVKINPNMARNANVLGISREVAALTRQPLRKPELDQEKASTDRADEDLSAMVRIEISNPELNPRFTLGLIRDIRIGPSPYWVQRRLRLAGMRPINNIVDATNYTMLEVGQPLHAFDYDVLRRRAGAGPIVISTRTARAGEKLLTLDGVERALTDTNVLVCDVKGPISLGGIMGGGESEVSEATTTVLLEAAAWDFINIRRTANQHNLPSEASFRFSRGVHPSLAEEGQRRGLQWMAQWSGGRVAASLADSYPLPPRDPVVVISEGDVQRLIGIDLPTTEIVDVLERLAFRCEVHGHGSHERITVYTPPFRMDIGEDIVGVADLAEEVARIHGYARIPEHRLADPLPPQRSNPAYEREQRLRDLLAEAGLQEVITHRMTAPELESRLLPLAAPLADKDYVRLANPISPDKRVMRRSLLASVLAAVERNARLRDRLGFFEIGSVFLPRDGGLPEEPGRLVIAIAGRRREVAWDEKSTAQVDFYDLKGIVESLLDALHIGARFLPDERPSFHPGKCALVLAEGRELGVLGELHPVVQGNFGFASSVLASELDLDALYAVIPGSYAARPVSEFPPVLEDIAVIVDESLPAERVEALIRQTGGKTLAQVRLFDVFRDDKIGANKKSLAYALTYQSLDGTLTDKDAAGVRNRIVRRLEQELGAKLRS